MMKQHSFAVFSVVVGLVVGILGQIIFYGQTIGISFPLFTLLIISVILFSADFARRPINKRNLWILLPLLFFAAMVAIRSNPDLTILNILAVLALGGLWMHYGSAQYFVDEETTFQHIISSSEAWIGTLFEPMEKYIEAWGWFKEHRWKSSEPVMAVVRGLLITLPIVVLFALLLGSADVMFGKYVGDFFNIMTFDSLPGLISRVVVSLSLAWMATGMLAYSLSSPIRRSMYFVASPEEAADPLQVKTDSKEEAAFEEDDSEVEESPLVKRRPSLFQLGMIESSMLLGSLDILFAVFVLVQFKYFFGGTANITVEGYTYAEYARRGFFELQAVSMLMLGLVLGLDSLTIRKTKREVQIFRVLACVIVGLMFIIIGAASRRMLLYEDAYGFTHLRVYSHWFILWTGVLFVFFLLNVFRIRANIFSLGILIFLIGYLGTLNVMNIDSYIAKENIVRYKNGEILDICYLRQLSLDALPPILTLYEESKDSDETIRYNIEWWMKERLYYLRQERASRTIFEINLAKDYAWNELNPLQLDSTPDTSSFQCSDTSYRRDGF